MAEGSAHGGAAVAVTEVSIARIAAGGDGVGKLDDGMTVFVPRTAPGDLAEIEVSERRRRYARGKLRRLVRAGQGRTEPGCPHYVREGCGGCQLQHLELEAQRDAKRAIVGDALRRIGGHAVENPRIVPSPDAWEYRSRVTLAAAPGRVGFHRFDRPGAVFDLAACRLARRSIGELWSRLREQQHLFPDGLTSLALREDRDGGLHAVFSATGRVWDAAPLARVLGRDDVSLWWIPGGGAPRVLAGARSVYPVLAFEQVHPAFGDRIRRDAIAGLGSVDGLTVWDLYGGTGDTARALAEQGAQVWSVDADRRAVEWGKATVEATPTGRHIRWVAGLVEEVVGQLPRPDVVVVNPPRTGMARAVSEAIDSWAVGGAGKTGGTGKTGGRLAYVSCDPATLARDLTRMPHLGLRSAIAYDLFPQTSHVEVLAVMEVT